MNAVFVTGTETDIGKTWLSAAILRRCRMRGIAARGLKPVASGYDPARPEESDAGALLAAMGAAIDAASVAAISPWRFAAPLSPDMAARREGRVVAAPEVVAFCRREMASASSPLLIEGVGGVLSPMTSDATCADVARDLGCPALVVCGSYLGAISHALTAVGALASRGVPIAALVVNETPGGVSLRETAETIQRFAPAVCVLDVPRAVDESPSIGAVVDRCWTR